MKSEKFLENLLRDLVTHPDDVKVEKSDRLKNGMVVLSVDVHPDDRGLVVGKKGYTANAIRQLLLIIGWKTSESIKLEFVFDVNRNRVSERVDEEVQA